jgi:basic membrane lipoprotein Med (substrate-binding protein (PBP1-ABC) superfamily)
MDGLNTIVVPESAVNESVKEELHKRKIKLIKTVGVPHNKSTEEVIKAYEAWNRPNMPADQKFLLVSLSGDALDASDTMHYYRFCRKYC